VSTHELFGSDAAGQFVQSGATTPPGMVPVPGTGTVPFASARHEARAVTNVAVGGNHALTKVIRVHAGYATDQSPVASATGSMFRQVDLWHATGGVSFTSRRLGGSIGVGYSRGAGNRSTFGGASASESVSTQLRVRTLSVLYALTIGFHASGVGSERMRRMLRRLDSGPFRRIRRIRSPREPAGERSDGCYRPNARSLKPSTTSSTPNAIA